MNYTTRDCGHVVHVMIVIGFIKTGGYYSNIIQVGNNYVIVIVFIKTIGYQFYPRGYAIVIGLIKAGGYYSNITQVGK